MFAPFIASSLGRAATAPTSLITWNPADKGSGITLSGGNLTATGDGTGSRVRATGPYVSGSKIFSATPSSITTQCIVGIGSASASLSGYLGGDTQSVGWLNNAGVYFNGAPFAGVSTTYTVGDQVDIGYDGTTLRFFKNGTSVGSVAFGAAWYPMASLITATITTDFGPSSPSGYSYLPW